MVYYDVEWLYVSVDDAVRVGVVKRLAKLVGVESDVDVRKVVDQLFGFDVGDVLENEAGSLRDSVAGHVKQLHNVGASVKRLEDFGFAVDLLGADGLQNLNDTVLVVGCIDAFVDL